MTLLVVLIVASSLWVLFDARSIGVAKGKVKGIFDMGPVGWFLSSLLFWVVGFPAYLVVREQHRKASDSPPTDVPGQPARIPEDGSPKIAPAPNRSKLLKSVGIRLIVYPIVTIAAAVVIVFGLLYFSGGINSDRNDQVPELYVHIDSPGPGGRDYQIRFTGSILTTNNGQVTSQSVSGLTPATFNGGREFVSAAIQKASAGDETLRVEVMKNIKVVNRGSTSAQFGVVTLTSR